jgi:hypothetical protein
LAERGWLGLFGQFIGVVDYGFSPTSQAVNTKAKKQKPCEENSYDTEY